MGKLVSCFRIHNEKKGPCPVRRLFVDKPGKMCYTG